MATKHSMPGSYRVHVHMLLCDVEGLAPPSYVGSWHHLYAKTDEGHEFMDYHNLGQIPVYVDVQVQPRNGDNVDYTFPGVGSAQSSSRDIEKEIGGVVYMYDDSKVVVKCPDGTNGVMQVIFTGEDWLPTYKQKEIEAWIRVRVWLQNDFPNPVFSSGWLPVSVNDASKTHLTVDSGIVASSLTNYFIIVKVRVSDGGPLHGMVCDAQGSSLALTPSSQWGGVIYQVRGTTFHIWTPAYRTDWSSGKGSICNMGDGWGGIMKGYGEQGEVLIEVFNGLGLENFNDVTVISRGSSNQKSHVTGNVDIDTDIVTGKVYQTVQSETHVWPAFGGVFYPTDAGQNYGGVVFAYSTSKIRIWYPLSNKGFYIDQNWGSESSTTEYKDWTFMSKVYTVSTCGQPVSVADGYFSVSGSSPYAIGTDVTYSCVTGTSLISGDLKRTCSHSGWNGTLPVCGIATPVNCSIPPNVQNAAVQLVSDQTLEGDTANITCDEGFNMTGGSVITCQSDGNWTTPPICNATATVVNCSDPPAVLNGSVQYSSLDTSLGDTATVTCNSGFSISGDAMVTCQGNGSWSMAPICINIATVVNCSDPPAVLNGSVQYSSLETSLGDTAMVTCNSGFNISGDAVMTCQGNGSWSTAPKCISIATVVNCSDPPAVLNGSVQYSSLETSLNDAATVTCNSGFNISGDAVMTCQGNGSWSLAPICISTATVVNCFDPPAVLNGSVKYSSLETSLNDTATVTCNSGFNISGDVVMICQGNGSWSLAPTCVATITNCFDPPAVLNGSVQYSSQETSLGDTATVTCNSGFNISGDAVMTCQGNGSWSLAPTCVATGSLVNCSAPFSVQNGTVHLIQNETLLGDIANITCDTGFNLTGDSTITCQSNATWSPSPVCNSIGIATNCSVPPAVENGTVHYLHDQTSVGDKANITCHSGFNISGDSTITCQYDGTWSSTPVCNSISTKTCLCSCYSVQDSDNRTLEESILEIVRNLTVESKSTSKYRRTKESAEDDRASAVTLGYLGGLVLGIAALVILCVDGFNLLNTFCVSNR